MEPRNYPTGAASLPDRANRRPTNLLRRLPMPTLSADVGEGGVNRMHDVTVVQILLHLATNPNTKQPYYHPGYDGRSDTQTGKAISAFQEVNHLTGHEKG